jgi:uncharacterized protein (DUF3820 family)
MSRHGRAQMPWGKFRGVRIRLLPDSYLSWLTTAPMMRDPQWRWLWESLIAELKWRGLRYDLAHTEEPVVDVPLPVENHRKIRLVGEPEPTVQDLDFCS